MPETGNTPNLKESVISYILLGGIAFIGGTLFLKQNHFDIQKYGLAAQASLQAETTASSSVNLAKFVPAGFTEISEPQSYTAENLYEKINGKAPQYIETGFVKLTSQRFAPVENTTKIIEISLYDMDTARNAFSIYSTQRRADSQAISDLSFAYKTANAAYIVLGKYYAEIVSYTDSVTSGDVVVSVAEKMHRQLGGDISGELSELDVLSIPELIKESIQLNKNGAFGFSNFEDVFAANYKIEDNQLTGFVTLTENSETAARKCKAYKEFLLENGASEISLSAGIPDSFAMDLFGYTEIVFYLEDFICGVHQAPDKQAAARLAEKLYNRLKSKHGGK